MNNQFLVTCTDLTIRFGDEVVLKEFSFDVPKNKHTVFKGESGSGKSTLLKLLLGFLKPTEGSVKYHDGKTAREMRQYTAWLPQDLDLGEGTVKEVINQPFRFSNNNLNRPDLQTSQSVLSKLGLHADNLTKRFRDLSTGQRQRVGLAICHLLDKPILLLDEPTSALDTASKKRAYHLLLEHTNNTVISTSHDPFWVEHADNIIPLD
jgi:ABC-type multidrug transport system ATPase subunit